MRKLQDDTGMSMLLSPTISGVVAQDGAVGWRQ